MSVYAYLSWFCDTFVSCDWRTMNHAIGDAVLVNIPLSIVVSLHTLALSILVYVIVDWIVVSRSRKARYDAGYWDGAQSRAVKLAQIKVGKEPKGGDIVLWEPPVDELAREIDARYTARRETGV